MKKAMKELIEKLEKLDPTTEEYTCAAKNLLTLSEVKRNEWLVSPEIVLQYTANLIMLLLVLNYEQLNVLSSKAFGFLKRF